jgi:hypothetical protein
MNDTFDFRTLPEAQQLASYGAFFAMANADGVIDGHEVVTIFESLDVSNLSEEGQETVRSYLMSPPELEPCLVQLSSASDALRYGVMLRLVEVALADDVVLPGEERALAAGRSSLGVSMEQQEAMCGFLEQVAAVRERGIDDHEASDSLKSGVATLTGMGVPAAAIFFSGGVASLGGAGIPVGLAALGLGFGMVPGLGMAMLLGATGVMAAHWALGVGRKGAQLRAAEAARGRRLVSNLEPTISDLAERVRALEATGAAASEVEILRRRLRALQRLLVQARGRSAD